MNEFYEMDDHIKRKIQDISTFLGGDILASVIIPLRVLSVLIADKTTNNSHALQSHE